MADRGPHPWTNTPLVSCPAWPEQHIFHPPIFASFFWYFLEKSRLIPWIIRGRSQLWKLNVSDEASLRTACWSFQTNTQTVQLRMSRLCGPSRNHERNLHPWGSALRSSEKIADFIFSDGPEGQTTVGQLKEDRYDDSLGAAGFL